MNGGHHALVEPIERAVMERSGRKQGGEVCFLCPAHDDHRPSARWNRDKGVWRCDACQTGGGARDLAERLGIDPPCGGGGGKRETVYRILDGAGLLVAEHIRVEDDEGKRFFWRQNGRAGLGGIPAANLPLFGAEQVRSFDRGRPVFVTEGEKAATELLAIGAQAVGTVTGAAGTPAAASLAVLQGFDVVLWPDHDSTGVRHMNRIAALLQGVAKSVRIFAPPGLPAGGDAVEWLGSQTTDRSERDVLAIARLEATVLSLPVKVGMLAAEGDTGEDPGLVEQLPAGSDVGPIEAALAALFSAPDAGAAEPPLRQLGEALRSADPLRRATVRELAVAALGGRVSAPAHLVDAALAADRSAPARQGSAVSFEEPEVWAYPVECAELLAELAAVLIRYVALPAHAEVAIALWIVHAHALGAAEVSPLLALASPEKRCGKTRTLSLLSRLVPRPLPSSNITPAAVFRSIEVFSPTLLIDEAETFLGEREELRGVLNSGHGRDTAFVVRTSGDDHEPRRFSTWAAKAVALIGNLPETLADRSIVIPMRRRAPEERVAHLRLDRQGEFEPVKRRAMRWAADRAAELRRLEPLVPSGLSDRAADNWRPLLAIADLAGGAWAGRARQVAVELSGAVEAQEGTREQLLADLRLSFLEHGKDRIFTDVLLAKLVAREDRPWRERRRGEPLTAVQLAKLLKPFGIRPRLLREGEVIARGYEVRDFEDAFARYLPTNPLHPLQANPEGGLPAIEPCYSSAHETPTANGANCCAGSVVTEATGRRPPLA